MDRFGYVAPMVLNESNGRLLAGHGRLDELKMLKTDGKPPPEGVRVKDGEWLAPVVMGVRLGAQAGKAYTIADNRLVELGGWDEPRLVDALISLSNGNLDGTGYDRDDVDQLIRLYRPELLGPEPPEPEIDRAAELQKKWGTELGQLWQIGKHRLICGDATKAEDIERLLNGAAPDLLVTDPPYGIQFDPEWRDRAGINTMGRAEKPYGNDIRWDWSDAFQLVASLNVCYVWHAESHAIEVANGLVRIGFKTLHQIIWDKQMAARTRTHYWAQHEPCWYGFKPNHSNWIGNYGVANSTVWSIPSPKHLMSGSDEKKEAHPTQKPLECMARPIRNHSGNVYDPFLGSGTTMVAADQLDRICYGIEISPAYVAVTLERLSQMGLKPKLVSG